ncbi:VacJ family lipoprotein [Alcaligenaceae bacterium B3P038]|nr:VacJ family lipoprotein [Alcaligenaceae bacterium B3P038]
MKNIQTLVLAVIVSSTSACASNATKNPATAEAPVITFAATPPSETDNPPTGAIAGTRFSPAIAFAQPAPSSADVPEETMQAEQDPEEEYATSVVQDPWERFNRKMHSFNNVLDRFVLRPVSVGYDRITPDPVQSGVSRFFGNLRLPATAVNQALQGRPGQAGDSIGRFVVNSTVGIAGLFDPATHIGLPQRAGEDFGQTLATWGWRDSRYLVMPLLGPRTVRDTASIVVDSPMSPISQIDKSGVADKLTIMQMVDGRAQMLKMDQVREDSLDDYTFVRDAWYQRRNRQIEQDL